MTSRYIGRNIGINAAEIYSDSFKERRVGFIRQYFTANMPFPTQEQFNNLQSIPHVWKSGSRFYKLSQQYYKDPSMWWVIAWFNQTPTESHLEIGDIVNVPLPLERILRYFDI